jgi:EpsD family peptidyl-prolyl cis-trans isomerase
VKPLFAISVVALLLLGGCQRKAEGQTVAVVNGDEITIPELNFALQHARVPDSADKNAVRSQLLQKLIDRRLVAEQAQKDGIDKSPEFLNRQRQATEELLISMLASRRMNSQPLPSDREVSAFIESNPQMFAQREIWTVDQVLYGPTKSAAFGAEIKGTKSIDGILSVLEKYKVQFARQKNRLDTAAIPAPIYKQLSNLPPDVPFIIPAGDKGIANSIVSREAVPLTGDKAKPIAVAAIRKSQTTNTMESLVKSLRSSAKIEYQPGFAPKSDLSSK